MITIAMALGAFLALAGLTKGRRSGQGLDPEPTAIDLAP